MNAALQPFDKVTVSGYCLSEGRFFYRLPGTVAVMTIGSAPQRSEVKIWPDAHVVGDGKLWFHRRNLRVHKHERERVIYYRTCGGCDYTMTGRMRPVKG